MTPGSEIEKIVLVTVSGGVAYVRHDTVPPGLRVEIIDFDDLNEDSREFSRLSAAAQAYVREKFDKFS